MVVPAIKICGISTAPALDAAIKVRADHVGFVFFPPSPRAVNPAQASQLAARAAGRVSRVGLFVDADDALIAEALGAAQLDVLQLHGKESPERAAQIKARFGLPVWKAVAVAAPGALPTGKADLRVRGLSRAGLVLSSKPVDMGLAAEYLLMAATLADALTPLVHNGLAPCGASSWTMPAANAGPSMAVTANASISMKP